MSEDGNDSGFVNTNDSAFSAASNLDTWNPLETVQEDNHLGEQKSSDQLELSQNKSKKSSGGPGEESTRNISVSKKKEEPPTIDAKMANQGSRSRRTSHFADFLMDSNSRKTSMQVEILETPEDPIKDPWCDPTKPRVITFEDISAASFKIASGIRKTPCSTSHLSKMYNMEIFFKKEQMQYTGSFKERGARYTLIQLTPDQKAKGVIAASAGNHALAMAYHGQKLNISVTLVMPITAPIMKVSGCRQFGADIIIHGNHLGESRSHALGLAQERGLMYVNGYDHPNILAGQGTMGLEIMEQVPDVEAVVIPAGGGGLIAGTALAIKSLNPNVQIYGVESVKCPSFSEAMKAGKPVYVKPASTLADGLAVPMVGVNAFATGAPLIDRMVVVDEDYIALAILRLIEVEKSVVEGAGATGMAAIVQGLCPELQGKKVVVALCGGNIDTTILGRCLDRGLAADDRLCRFVVRVSDRPGGIAELTKLMYDLGVSIKDIFHERAWVKSNIYAVAIKCVVETRDTAHAQELRESLFSKYKHVQWGARQSYDDGQESLGAFDDLKKSE